jgi:hypothetical protein
VATCPIFPPRTLLQQEMLQRRIESPKIIRYLRTIEIISPATTAANGPRMRVLKRQTSCQVSRNTTRLGCFGLEHCQYGCFGCETVRFWFLAFGLGNRQRWGKMLLQFLTVTWHQRLVEYRFVVVCQTPTRHLLIKFSDLSISPDPRPRMNGEETITGLSSSGQVILLP